MLSSENVINVNSLLKGCLGRLFSIGLYQPLAHIFLAKLYRMSSVLRISVRRVLRYDSSTYKNHTKTGCLELNDAKPQFDNTKQMYLPLLPF